MSKIKRPLKNYRWQLKIVKVCRYAMNMNLEMVNHNIKKSCPTRGSKINKFFLKLRNCLYSLSAKKEQIFKKMQKNS